jgi:LacI family transcriptional regulator
MKITIKDIAEAAGVSVSTVSRALRNDPAANDQTAKRIVEIAHGLNYFPNSLARGLRENKTRTVGVIFNDLNNPFYTEILGEIGERLNEADYSLVICYSHYDLERERRNIVSLLSRRVDGIIISPIDERSSNLEILSSNGVDTVVIDGFPYATGLSYVYTDHSVGIRLATEHLIANGHRNILLITAPSREVGRSERFGRAFRETLQKHGLSPSQGQIARCQENTISAGYEAFGRIVKDAGGVANLFFTAVVTISDLLAVGIYKLANEIMLKIPEDLSIVGYDNIEVSGALSPPLTTIHQSRKRIGAESVKILMANIENVTKDVRRVSFDPRLVERKSVRTLQIEN